ALRLASIGEKGRADLSIGEPVGSDRRPRAEKLLGEDQPLEVRALLPTVTPRPRVADPTARSERSREFAREADDPAVVARLVKWQRLAQEGANLLAQGRLGSG